MNLRERAFEVLTDPRLEPHLFLAGLLLALAVAAGVLFVLYPAA